MKQTPPPPTLFQAIAPQASAMSTLARITSTVKREVEVPRAPDLAAGADDQGALRQVLARLKGGQEGGQEQPLPGPARRDSRSASKRAVVPPPNWPRNSSQGG